MPPKEARLGSLFSRPPADPTRHAHLEHVFGRENAPDNSRQSHLDRVYQRTETKARDGSLPCPDEDVLNATWEESAQSLEDFPVDHTVSVPSRMLEDFGLSGQRVLCSYAVRIPDAIMGRVERLWRSVVALHRSSSNDRNGANLCLRCSAVFPCVAACRMDAESATDRSSQMTILGHSEVPPCVFERCPVLSGETTSSQPISSKQNRTSSVLRLNTRVLVNYYAGLDQQLVNVVSVAARLVYHKVCPQSQTSGDGPAQSCCNPQSCCSPSIRIRNSGMHLSQLCRTCFRSRDRTSHTARNSLRIHTRVIYRTIGLLGWCTMKLDHHLHCGGPVDTSTMFPSQSALTHQMLRAASHEWDRLHGSNPVVFLRRPSQGTGGWLGFPCHCRTPSACECRSPLPERYHDTTSVCRRGTPVKATVDDGKSSNLAHVSSDMWCLLLVHMCKLTLCRISVSVKCKGVPARHPLFDKWHPCNRRDSGKFIDPLCSTLSPMASVVRRIQQKFPHATMPELLRMAAESMGANQGLMNVAVACYERERVEDGDGNDDVKRENVGNASHPATPVPRSLTQCLSYIDAQTTAWWPADCGGGSSRGCVLHASGRSCPDWCDRGAPLSAQSWTPVRALWASLWGAGDEVDAALFLGGPSLPVRRGVLRSRCRFRHLSVPSASQGSSGVSGVPGDPGQLGADSVSPIRPRPGGVPGSAGGGAPPAISQAWQSLSRATPSVSTPGGAVEEKIGGARVRKSASRRRRYDGPFSSLFGGWRFVDMSEPSLSLERREALQRNSDLVDRLGPDCIKKKKKKKKKGKEENNREEDAGDDGSDQFLSPSLLLKLKQPCFESRFEVMYSSQEDKELKFQVYDVAPPTRGGKTIPQSHVDKGVSHLVDCRRIASCLVSLNEIVGDSLCGKEVAFRLCHEYLDAFFQHTNSVPTLLLYVTGVRMSSRASWPHVVRKLHYQWRASWRVPRSVRAMYWTVPAVNTDWTADTIGLSLDSVLQRALSVDQRTGLVRVPRSESAGARSRLRCEYLWGPWLSPLVPSERPTAVDCVSELSISVGGGHVPALPVSYDMDVSVDNSLAPPIHPDGRFFEPSALLRFLEQRLVEGRDFQMWTKSAGNQESHACCLSVRMCYRRNLTPLPSMPYDPGCLLLRLVNEEGLKSLRPVHITWAGVLGTVQAQRPTGIIFDAARSRLRGAPDSHDEFKTRASPSPHTGTPPSARIPPSSNQQSTKPKAKELSDAEEDEVMAPSGRRFFDQMKRSRRIRRRRKDAKKVRRAVHAHIHRMQTEAEREVHQKSKWGGGDDELKAQKHAERRLKLELKRRRRLRRVRKRDRERRADELSVCSSVDLCSIRFIVLGSAVWELCFPQSTDTPPAECLFSIVTEQEQCLHLLAGSPVMRDSWAYGLIHLMHQARNLQFLWAWRNLYWRQIPALVRLHHNRVLWSSELERLQHSPWSVSAEDVASDGAMFNHKALFNANDKLRELCMLLRVPFDGLVTPRTPVTADVEHGEVVVGASNGVHRASGVTDCEGCGTTHELSALLGPASGMLDDSMLLWADDDEEDAPATIRPPGAHDDGNSRPSNALVGDLKEHLDRLRGMLEARGVELHHDMVYRVAAEAYQSMMSAEAGSGDRKSNDTAPDAPSHTPLSAGALLEAPPVLTVTDVRAAGAVQAWLCAEGESLPGLSADGGARVAASDSQEVGVEATGNQGDPSVSGDAVLLRSADGIMNGSGAEESAGRRTVSTSVDAQWVPATAPTVRNELRFPMLSPSALRTFRRVLRRVISPPISGSVSSVSSGLAGDAKSSSGDSEPAGGSGSQSGLQYLSDAVTRLQADGMLVRSDGAGGPSQVSLVCMPYLQETMSDDQLQARMTTFLVFSQNLDVTGERKRHNSLWDRLSESGSVPLGCVGDARCSDSVAHWVLSAGPVCQPTCSPRHSSNALTTQPAFWPCRVFSSDAHGSKSDDGGSRASLSALCDGYRPLNPRRRGVTVCGGSETQLQYLPWVSYQSPDGPPTCNRQSRAPQTRVVWRMTLGACLQPPDVAQSQSSSVSCVYAAVDFLAAVRQLCWLTFHPDSLCSDVYLQAMFASGGRARTETARFAVNAVALVMGRPLGRDVDPALEAVFGREWRVSQRSSPSVCQCMARVAPNVGKSLQGGAVGCDAARCARRILAGLVRLVTRKTLVDDLTAAPPDSTKPSSHAREDAHCGRKTLRLWLSGDALSARYPDGCALTGKPAVMQWGLGKWVAGTQPAVMSLASFLVVSLQCALGLRWRQSLAALQERTGGRLTQLLGQKPTNTTQSGPWTSKMNAAFSTALSGFPSSYQESGRAVDLLLYRVWELRWRSVGGVGSRCSIVPVSSLHSLRFCRAPETGGNADLHPRERKYSDTDGEPFASIGARTDERLGKRVAQWRFGFAVPRFVEDGESCVGGMLNSNPVSSLDGVEKGVWTFVVNGESKASVRAAVDLSCALGAMVCSAQ